MAENMAMESTSARTDEQHQSHKPRRHAKKGSDPFKELDDDAVKLSSQSSVNETNEAKSSSTLVELILTPLTMISFLLSLVAVDRQQREWRVAQHSSDHATLWSRLTHGSPEPYQDPRDGTWNHSAPPARPTKEFEGWYARKKHRSIAHMEIRDAFKLRGKVLVALIVLSSLAVVALTYAVKRMRLLLGV